MMYKVGRAAAAALLAALMMTTAGVSAGAEMPMQAGKAEAAVLEQTNSGTASEKKVTRLKVNNHDAVRIGNLKFCYTSNSAAIEELEKASGTHEEEFYFKVENVGSEPVSVWTWKKASEFQLICNGQTLSGEQSGCDGYWVEDEAQGVWVWQEDTSGMLPAGKQTETCYRVQMPAHWEQCTVIYTPVSAPDTIVEITIDNPWL